MSQPPKSLRLLTRKPDVQLSRGRLSEKNVHEIVPKCIMGYDPTLFRALLMWSLLLLFSFRTCDHTSMASRAIISNTPNHPQYLLGLSRALLPTTFLEIAVYTKPIRVSVLLCYTRTFHALCKFRHNYKPLLRKARN